LNLEIGSNSEVGNKSRNMSKEGEVAGDEVEYRGPGETVLRWPEEGDFIDEGESIVVVEDCCTEIAMNSQYRKVGHKRSMVERTKGDECNSIVNLSTTRRGLELSRCPVSIIKQHLQLAS
jgi:hypothetical protein